MNPQQPKRPPLFRFGNVSSKVRIALLAGAVVLLLILVIGFKNMLAAGNNFIPSMVTVAQDQYELVHLAAGGVQNAVDDNTRNFAVTAQASLQSQQNDTVAYLAGNGRKVKTKELAAKLSKPLDSRLSDALAASNYDSTFRDIMKSSLTAYQHDLQQAYRQDTGPKGRAMLNDYYKAAGLLLKQLGS